MTVEEALEDEGGGSCTVTFPRESMSPLHVIIWADEQFIECVSKVSLGGGYSSSGIENPSSQTLMPHPLQMLISIINAIDWPFTRSNERGSAASHFSCFPAFQ